MRKSSKKIRFLSNKLIYKARHGHIYDHENKKYNCFIPAISGSYRIIDCWVCDQHGNVHPGYNISPAAIYSYNLGEIIGETELI